ncbi:MAG: hypothetical protein ACKPKO_29120, partial [Candidatus Fonsibacter sp.]
ACTTATTCYRHAYNVAYDLHIQHHTSALVNTPAQPAPESRASIAVISQNSRGPTPIHIMRMQMLRATQNFLYLNEDLFVHHLIYIHHDEIFHNLILLSLYIHDNEDILLSYIIIKIFIIKNKSIRK